MLVIKIELWPCGKGGGRIREIGRLVIFNKGDSTDPNRGNYVAQLMRRGTADRIQREGPIEPADARELFARFDTFAGPDEVLDHPRTSAPVWSLVAKALKVLKIPGT